MLVLSRSKHEAIFVGSDVKVTLLGVRVGEAAVGGAKVKFGFQAPRDVSIQREEVLALMQSKTSSGASSGSQRPKQNIAGTIHPVPDAVVQVQIEAPPEVPIHCSRPSESPSGHRRIVPASRTQSISSEQPPASDAPLIRVFDCRKDDDVLIGHESLMKIVEVFRFVADAPPAGDERRPRGEG